MTLILGYYHEWGIGALSSTQGLMLCLNSISGKMFSRTCAFKTAPKQDAGRSKRCTRRHGRVCCESEKIQGITIAIHCYCKYTTKMLQCFWLENLITLVTFTTFVRVVLSSATTGNPGILQHTSTKE